MKTSKLLMKPLNTIKSNFPKDFNLRGLLKDQNLKNFMIINLRVSFSLGAQK